MSKRYAPVQLIVHYPSTQEGKDELMMHVAEVHAEKVKNFIDELYWTTEEKIKLLDAIIENYEN